MRIYLLILASSTRYKSALARKMLSEATRSTRKIYPNPVFEHIFFTWSEGASFLQNPKSDSSCHLTSYAKLCYRRQILLELMTCITVTSRVKNGDHLQKKEGTRWCVSNCIYYWHTSCPHPLWKFKYSLPKLKLDPVQIHSFPNRIRTRGRV